MTSYMLNLKGFPAELCNTKLKVFPVFSYIVAVLPNKEETSSIDFLKITQRYCKSVSQYLSFQTRNRAVEKEDVKFSI